MLGCQSSGTLQSLIRHVKGSSCCPARAICSTLHPAGPRHCPGIRSFVSGSPQNLSPSSKNDYYKTYRLEYRTRANPRATNAENENRGSRRPYERGGARQSFTRKDTSFSRASGSSRAWQSGDSTSASRRDVASVSEKKEKEPWMVQKTALEKKFGETGWNPRKKLSPDALEGIRALHHQQPEVYTTEILANEFEVSAEAIRRILKSKWQPGETVAADRRVRWEKRGEKIWAAKAEAGEKPPKKWREALGIKLQPRRGVGGPRARPGLGRGSAPIIATKGDTSDFLPTADP